ncbi:MAG TPA: hypothetical protein PLN52_17850 [Opitutaceae bacterium]|nr:hypothetical protein [Opitutaceae bacterium]
MGPHSAQPYRPLIKWVTWVCVGLVLSLNILAVSPELHAFLHGHAVEAPSDHIVSPGCSHGACQESSAPGAETADAMVWDDGGCVVTLFSHGVLVMLDVPALLVVEWKEEASVACALDARLRGTRRSLHPLSHAPPHV